MFRIIKLALWISVILGGITWWKYTDFQNTQICPELPWDGVFVVEKGETFWSVLSAFSDNDFFTKLYLKNNPPDFELQAGKYKLDCGNIESLVEDLRTPINETDTFITFLEWWNIYDIDKTLTGQWLISAGDFSSFATNCDTFCWLKDDYWFLQWAKTLEGFLYPDTYAIHPWNFTIEKLVKKMLDRFQEKVIDSDMMTGLSNQEIIDEINMASIVQKEANKRDNPKEISIIAGVLKKRLSENWMIGADATICYAYEIATQDCTPEKVLEYLYEKNEYNTRQMTWLPKTPIANPEAEVIQATVNSSDSPYYYYLHDSSWQIHYGENEADHNRNKSLYLQ